MSCNQGLQECTYSTMRCAFPLSPLLSVSMERVLDGSNVGSPFSSYVPCLSYMYSSSFFKATSVQIKCEKFPSFLLPCLRLNEFFVLLSTAMEVCAGIYTFTCPSPPPNLKTGTSHIHPNHWISNGMWDIIVTRQKLVIIFLLNTPC